MPQLIVLGLAAALAYYCWRVLKRELAILEEKDRANRNVARQTSRNSSENSDKGSAPGKRDQVENLTRDPQTGVYRVDKD